MSRQTLMLVTPYFPPAGGGLEQYAKHIAAGLDAAHDWRIVVVTSGEHRGTDSVTTEDGLTIYRLSYDFKLSNSVIGLRWPKKLKAIIAAERPDIINAHMPTPGLADVAARVSGRTPFVVTYHTASMKKGSWPVDLLIGAYEKLLLPAVLRRARTIICSSDFVRDTFLSAYRAKTITITAGVDEIMFHPAKAKTGAKQVMLFVGNYGPAYRHKGLADAVAALGQLAATHPQLELHIAGLGDNATFIAQAEQLGVAGRLKFMGWQAPAALAQLYPQASVVVLPSKSDSFPLVLVDAMACAIPVVSTTVGGIPTVIKHGQTGLLVPPGQPSALAAAINTILSDPALARRFGEAGRAEVLRSLTWTQKARATDELYGQALKAHICQITAYYPPHLGGVENMVQQLSHQLAATGYTVDVLTSRVGLANSMPGTEPAGLRVRRLHGFELLHTPVLPGLFMALLRQPAGTVYHLHIAQAGLPEITWLAAKLRHRPFIAHIHLDVDPSGRIGRLILAPYKRLILAFVLRQADQVVTLTDRQVGLMTRQYRLNPKRVTVIPNGVGEAYFAPARPTFHQPLRLLFVGRLAVQKRPERIIAAMQELPQAHLEVVGDGPDRAQHEAYAAAHNLTNVTFRGALRDAQLRQAYADADALVLPSDKEGMPLTLLEAMAAGLPIIGSDVVGIRELITGVGVLVSNPSAATFAAAVAALAADPSRLATMSAASRSAADAYSWQRLAGDVTALYREVQR